MKQFLHLMKLEWKYDLCICLGIPLFLVLNYCYFFPQSLDRPYYEKIELFGYRDTSPMFYMLFFFGFLTPWISIYNNPTVRERLQSQQWTFTLPMCSAIIFHRGWIRTMIMVLFVLAIPFLRMKNEMDAEIRFYSNSEEKIAERFNETKAFFPSAELKMLKENEKLKPTIVIKNGRFLIRLFNFTLELWIYLFYLNFIFWSIPKAVRFKRVRWVTFGLFGVVIVAPFLGLMSLDESISSRSLQYLFLSSWMKWWIPLTILSLMLLGLTYFHGLRAYRHREIE